MKPAANSMFEAIQTQVMWNRLISVVEEQAQALLRTAWAWIASNMLLAAGFMGSPPSPGGRWN